MGCVFLFTASFLVPRKMPGSGIYGDKRNKLFFFSRDLRCARQIQGTFYLLHISLSDDALNICRLYFDLFTWDPGYICLNMPTYFNTCFHWGAFSFLILFPSLLYSQGGTGVFWFSCLSLFCIVFFSRAVIPQCDILEVSNYYCHWLAAFSNIGSIPSHNTLK